MIPTCQKGFPLPNDTRVASGFQVEVWPEVWYAGGIGPGTPLKLAAKYDKLSGGTINRDRLPLKFPRKYDMLGGEARNGGSGFAPLLPQTITNSPRMSRHSAAKCDMLVSHARTGGVRGLSPLVSGLHAEPLHQHLTRVTGGRSAHGD